LTSASAVGSLKFKTALAGCLAPAVHKLVMEDFRRQFLIEAAANLRALAEDWRRSNSNFEAISDTLRRDAFRTLHTVKGTAQTFGFNSSSRLAHELETLLSVVKNERTAAGGQPKILFLEGVALLIESLERKTFEIPASFRERIKSFIPQTSVPEKIAENFPPDIPDKFFSQLSVQEKNAVRAAGENEKNIFCFEVNFETANFADELINFRESLYAVGEIIATLPSAKSSDDGVIGFQILFASSAASPKIQAIAEASAARIIFSSSQNAFSSDTTGVLAQIVKHGEETASILGKRIKFEISTDETKLSPPNLKLVFAALLHLVRNAVDHAIETSGQIEIQLTTQANKLRLIVSDDGRGIDANEIKAQAVRKNLISASRILTEQETLDLIFLPEFSTKSAATEISGRGIGLDTVKVAIEKAGGAISVKSRNGKGTIFEIVLPQ
jgi:two-component system chemotaxis sensor kinase CheA